MLNKKHTVLVVLAVFLSWDAAMGASKLVFLDGSTVMAEDFSVVKGMLACRTEEHPELVLSFKMLNWAETRIHSPDVYALVYPDKAAEYQAALKKKAGSSNGVVITNDDLKTLPPIEESKVEWTRNLPEPGSSKSVIANSKQKDKNKPAYPSISTVGRGGKKITLSRYYDSEKYVLFDFYASWCGPCRQLTPQLEAFIKKYPSKVALKKIDIVNWGTPVTKQHRINSVPHVKLYAPGGKKIKEGNGFEVLDYAKSIARKEGWKLK